MVAVSPDGLYAFVEVPKTASTAARDFLQADGWRPNSVARKGWKIPGLDRGRHAALTPEATRFMDDRGIQSFAVIRNPWDRMASLWRSSTPAGVTLNEYLKTGRFPASGMSILHTPQCVWAIGVTETLRYEHLIEDWNNLADRWPDFPRLNPKHGLPVVNKRNPGREPEWDEESLEIVRTRFSIDAERWGYTGPTK